MPKVSIIIPTYNRGYIVREAIDSILSQTVKDIEVLVIDDGSTDNTREVVEEINDDRIRYLYKENGGVSSARNVGLSVACGEYVAFLDSDDVWPEEFLEVTVRALENNSEFGLAYAATTHRYADGREKPEKLSRCLSGNLTVHLFTHSTIWPMSVLVRRDGLDGFWFDEGLKVCEDNDAFMRLSREMEILFVGDVGVVRRIGTDNLSNDAYTNGPKARALSLERFYFRLGGDKIVPRRLAMKRLSRCWRRVGERYGNKGCRKASIGFLKRAIRYYPFDVRLYIGLVKAVMLKKTKDSKADWHMPDALGEVFSSVGTGDERA